MRDPKTLSASASALPRRARMKSVLSARTSFSVRTTFPSPNRTLDCREAGLKSTSGAVSNGRNAWGSRMYVMRFSSSTVTVNTGP